MNDEDVGRERLAEFDLRNRARTVITSCGSVCVMSMRALEYTAFSMCSRRCRRDRIQKRVFAAYLQ